MAERGEFVTHHSRRGRTYYDSMILLTTCKWIKDQSWWLPIRRHWWSPIISAFITFLGSIYHMSVLRALKARILQWCEKDVFRRMLKDHGIGKVSTSGIEERHKEANFFSDKNSPPKLCGKTSLSVQKLIAVQAKKTPLYTQITILYLHSGDR